MDFLLLSLEALRRLAQRAGPYLMIDMVMPGGTLIALLLYCYRRARRRCADQAAAAVRTGALSVSSLR